jgi:hypothetical protein
LTIEPLMAGLAGPVFFMPWRAYLQPRNTPSELIASTRRQASTVVVSILPGPPPIPALLTMMSSRPSVDSTPASRDFHASSEATSCCTKRPGASSLPGWISATITRAPAPASSAAVAAPMPDAPPVTIATCPESSPLMPLSYSPRCARVPNKKPGRFPARVSCRVASGG